MDKNWIKDGMDVAHVDNIFQKMTVEKMVIRRQGEIFMVVGFKCHWWEIVANKPSKYQFGVFHSRELVPWDVALEGSTAVNKFREQIRNNNAE